MQRDRTSKYSRSVRGFLPGRQRLRSSFANEHSQGARWLILSSGHGSPSPPNAQDNVRREARTRSRGASPLRAQTWRHPYLEAHGSRIAAGFPRQLAQLVEGLQGGVPGRIVDGHEPVAILRSAVKRGVRAAAKPERHAPRRRTWIDPDVVEPMEVAGHG